MAMRGICTLRKRTTAKILSAFLVVAFLSFVSYLFFIRGPNVWNPVGFGSAGVVSFRQNSQRLQADQPFPGRSDLPVPTPSCQMDTCFDFSRCSLRSGFPVYFYSPRNLSGLPAQFAVSSVETTWSWKAYGTRDPDRACAFVLVMEGKERTGQNSDHQMTDSPGRTSAHQLADNAGRTSAHQLDSFLRSLPHWSKGNHLLINLAQTVRGGDVATPAETIDAHADEQGHAGYVMLAQPSFGSTTHFRQNYDIVIPPSPGPGSGGEAWSQSPPLFPAKRKYLVSFWGEYIRAAEAGGDNRDGERQPSAASSLEEVKGALARSGVEARILLSCAGSPSLGGRPSEWALCGTEGERSRLLSQSTFTLLLLPPSPAGSMTSSFLTRLREALQQGSVPVLLGGRHLQSRLPFSELLHWPGLSFFLTLSAATAHLPHVLASVPDSEVLEWRRRGRWAWQTYFSSDRQIVDAAVALLRSRLMIPPAPVPDYPGVILARFGTAANGTGRGRGG